MVPDEFEVWLCVDLHAYSSCSTQIDPFCFTYSEVDGVFVPWAFNSSLRLEKVAASTRRMIPNRNRDYSKLSPTHHITETSAPFQGKASSGQHQRTWPQDSENIRVPEHFDVPARQFTWSAFVTIMISSIVLGFAIWTVLLKGKTAEGDERAEKKPKSVEERLEHLESIKKYLPEAKYNQKIDQILKDI